MLNYINVFRALAILLIVLGHCYFVDNRILGSICNEIFDGGTVLFVFIAGFLFQHLSYKYETKTYFKKKFINVVMPYLITSIPGIIICFYAHNINPFYELNKFIQIPIFLTTGWIHNPPTWYIPMTCIFFALAPLLLFLEKKTFKQHRVLYILIPVLMLLTVIFPRVGVDNKLLVHADYSYWYKYLLELNIPFRGFVNLFSVYILGMYLSANKSLIKSLYNRRFSLILAMLFTAAADVILQVKGIYHNISLSKILLTLIVLGYLEHYDTQIIAHEKLNKIADIIAKYSFAIFFIHRYIIRGITILLPKVLHIERNVYITDISTCLKALAILILFFTLSLFGSLLIAWTIKQICLKLNIKNTRAVIGA